MAVAAVKPRQWWIEAEWPVWRLVRDGWAGLQEIDTHYTLDDVLDANEALDVAQDAKSTTR